MKKSLGKLALVTILATLALGVPMKTLADDTTPPPATPAPAPAPAPAPVKPKAIPFNGKLGAVDLVNKTITLDEKTKRTFQVTKDTKIMKAGKPATLEDGVVGDDVAGRYTKDDAGKLTAKSIRFGPKPAPAPPQ